MKEAAHNSDQALAGDPRALVFGEFRIDLARRVLYRGEKRVPIQKKPLAVLIYLVRQAPRMVPREELLQQFWSRTVNDEALTRCISTIRKLLRDVEDPPQFVETHRAQGYRFIAEVVRSTATVDAAMGWQGARQWLVAAGIGIAILAGLAWILRPEPAPLDPVMQRIERIAVLPIAVTTEDADWLQPALADHMLRAISAIEGVTVVASTLAPGDLDIQAHGQRLNVGAVLLTRLERNATGSRLHAQLVSVNDGALLWSTSLDSPHQIGSGEQVAKLAHSLAIRLRPAVQLSETQPQVDQRAYSYYLQARYYWAQRSAIGLQAAIAAYDAALRIDPDYTDALLGSAESWLLMPLYGAMAPRDAIPKAREFASHALERNPVSSRARAVLGGIAMQYDWDWIAAETLLREAVSLNPNNATAQQWLGEVFCYTSRFDSCRRQLRIAFDLDPLSPVLKMQQGSPALYSGDFETAVALYAEATASFPDYAMGRYALGLAYAGLGDWDSAVAAYRSALPDLGLAIVGGPLVYALGQIGAADQAQAMLQDLEALVESRHVPPSKLAVAYLGLGDRDRAVEELGRALELKDDRLVYFVNDVHFRDLIAEDGFREIARHIGF